MKPRTWVIEDHLCRGCGGRILRCVTGGGATGGGNPIFRCADCKQITSSMGPDSLCWCGFHHKHNHTMQAYRCLPFTILEERPELKRAFLACGCDPTRGEVGVILERDLVEQELR